MSTKQCEVIRDLLPLYIDGICSEESRRIVMMHLEECPECRRIYEDMGQPIKEELTEPELDSKQTFSAINHKWKKKKIVIACISVLLTSLLLFSGYMVYQNVSSVHDYFSPTYVVNLRDIQTDGEWQRIDIDDGGALVFDSIFYSREVVLDGNSDCAISIRISDNNGKVVLDETIIQPGTSVDLTMLERDTEYIVEVKADATFALLRFS